MAGVRQLPVHLELFGDGREVVGEVVQRNIEVSWIELDAHEEEVGFGVAVLVGVQDVAVVAEDEIGDGRDQAFAVGTGQQQDGGVLHVEIRNSVVSSVQLCALCGYCPFASASPFQQQRTRSCTEKKPPTSAIPSRSLWRRLRRTRRVRPAPGCVPEPHRYRFVDWRAVARPVEQRTHGEELVERQFAVEDVAAGEAVGVFQILRGDDLVAQDQLRQVRARIARASSPRCRRGLRGCLPSRRSSA